VYQNINYLVMAMTISGAGHSNHNNYEHYLFKEIQHNGYPLWCYEIFFAFH
jgi:hypothetical protein